MENYSFLENHTRISNLAEIITLKSIYWYSIINTFKQLKYTLKSSYRFSNKEILVCWSACCKTHQYLVYSSTILNVIAIYNTNLLFQSTFVICTVVITLCVYYFHPSCSSQKRCEFQKFNTFENLVNNTCNAREIDCIRIARESVSSQLIT